MNAALAVGLLAAFVLAFAAPVAGAGPRFVECYAVPGHDGPSGTFCIVRAAGQCVMVLFQSNAPPDVGTCR